MTGPTSQFSNQTHRTDSGQTGPARAPVGQSAGICRVVAGKMYARVLGPDATSGSGTPCTIRYCFNTRRTRSSRHTIHAVSNVDITLSKVRLLLYQLVKLNGMRLKTEGVLILCIVVVLSKTCFEKFAPKERLLVHNSLPVKTLVRHISQAIRCNEKKIFF